MDETILIDNKIKRNNQRIQVFQKRADRFNDLIKKISDDTESLQSQKAQILISKIAKPEII